MTRTPRQHHRRDLQAQSYPQRAIRRCRPILDFAFTPRTTSRLSSTEAAAGRRRLDPGRCQSRSVSRAGSNHRGAAVGMAAARSRLGQRSDDLMRRYDFDLAWQAAAHPPRSGRSAVRVLARFARCGSVTWTRKPKQAAAHHRSALVQGRDHLSAARQVVLRQQRRWHRRFSGADIQARLYRRPRGQRHLAAALLSLATTR